jgi:hypothetical protein
MAIYCRRALRQNHGVREEHGTMETTGLREIFHEGEVALQREAGVAERMARVGRQGIRDYMPEQHRAFFPLLPFVIAGSVSADGQPAASLLSAPAGFAASPSPTTLRVDALPMAGDPLDLNLQPGAPLGMLGIQAHTRRRNRLNGRIGARDSRGFLLDVAQSFGNCPKYIHPLRATYVGARSPAPLVNGRLTARARALILAADTLFIASAHPAARASGAEAHGADVSHRGGPPGFAHFVDDDTFIIPDYAGNDLYNTLGNMRLEPRVGLLFIDVIGGDLLLVECTALALAGSHPQARPDTGRIVRFRVGLVRHFPRASPLRFELPSEGRGR